MPYIDLFERENFYEISAKTLELYLQARVLIKKNKNINHANVFYCFPRLNIFVAYPLLKNSKDFIKRDNRVTNQLSKKILVLSYIWVALKFPRIFSDNYLVVMKDDISCNRILVYPGNKKLKIINFETNEVDNIVKLGFSKSWFLKEVQIRQDPKWDFVLPLELINDFTYKERFLNGYALTRVTAQNKKLIKGELSRIIDIMQKDFRYIEPMTYLSELRNQFRVKNEQIRNRLSTEDNVKLNKIFLEMAELFCDDARLIKTTFSHGDLQQGNIFIEDITSKVWILDWETWGERSEFYDKMILFYNFRNSNLLKKNIRYFIEDEARKLQLGILTQKQVLNILIVFFLEDILWQLEETSVLITDSLSNGLKNYLKTDILVVIDNILRKSVTN